MNFENIRMIQKKERNSGNLVEVGDDFYKNTSELISGESTALKEKNDPLKSRELENTVHISRDVFDLREQKLVMKALRSVRSGEDNAVHLTPEERVFYSKLRSLITSHREFFNSVVLGEYSLPKEAKLINDANPNQVLVRVKTEIPRFIGGDSVELGPFEANSVVKLSRKEADVLAQQNLVEIM